MAEPIKRPAIVTKRHLEFLDELRDSGETNMFGAGSYLTSRFKLTPKEARTVLLYWMATFGKKDR